ncbi:MAG: hypothetical protein ABS76_30200 [Pelagibacterium sp. SCN 64-44]|nr:MAG: hypothetical protein ABS76_30200 [Pelagibacterium sp. SCN 64-44]
MIKELFGDNPTMSQVSLTLGYALFGVLFVYLARPFEWQGVVLMIMAADIFGGVISNASRSTRAHWATKPNWGACAFVVVHLIELPIIWWLADGDLVFWVLTCAMLAKIGVFIVGQDETRQKPMA